MFKRVERFYISEYMEKPFLWRWLYEIANNLVDTEICNSILPNKNPLKWCVMDVVNLMHLVFIAALCAFAVPLLSALDARNNKFKFHGKDFYLSDVIIPW